MQTRPPGGYKTWRGNVSGTHTYMPVVVSLGIIPAGGLDVGTRAAKPVPPSPAGRTYGETCYAE